MRTAVVGDAPELARLRWEFRPGDQSGQELGEFGAEFERWLTEALSSGWMAAVAEDERGFLVGCMFLRTVPKVPNPGALDRAWGYVTNSFVAPDHRGRGIGARLLQAVIEVARSRGHEFLIVWPSPEAVSLYEREGFQAVSAAHEGPDDYPPLELALR